jgi:hypothetical protein
VAAWPRDEYCWWTAIHAALRVDTVGGRFTRAFAAVGLTGVVSRRIGDTVLVRAGPTELPNPKGSALYASRVVAYQSGDSTRFRWYRSITPRADDLTTVAESLTAHGGGIEFCGRIGKAVAISGVAPHGPTADDSIPVWERVP